MSPKKIKNVVLLMGKKEKDSFNRYTFPILGRPIALYPALAALNSQAVDAVYLSTDSPGLIQLGENIKEVRLLIREKSQPTLTEEVRHAVKLISKDIGYEPDKIVLMLANSPCIIGEVLTIALNFLDENTEYDSVASAMKRTEFNPMRMYRLTDENKLEHHGQFDSRFESTYFLDRRVMVVRAKTILKSSTNDNYFENLLGSEIYPLIQQDGIWDIDYIWQVPFVERWLRQNGFSELETPYKTAKSDSQQPASFTPQSAGAKNEKKKILISTVPFGEIEPSVIAKLKNTPNSEYVINPLGRKFKEDELAEHIKDFDVLIAGTEPITRKVMLNAPKLKLIARVGIGLDNVDLHAARELGITVTYTPDAPSPAVAELAVGQMFNLLRYLPYVDRKLRSGLWQRVSGERLMNSTIAIVGTGRIGSRVLRHVQGFNPKRILVNDLAPNQNLYEMYHAEFVEKEVIYKESDIITFHVPLNKVTYNMITKKEIDIMKKNVLLINTSRGGIINEQDLYTALLNNRIGGAAIDVFEIEPYYGNLAELDNCIISCHMGSMTNDCRAMMEVQATDEAIRFILGEELQGVVPETEYER